MERAQKPAAGTAVQFGADASATLPEHGRARAVIDAVRPVVDCGRYPVKRVVSEAVDAEADVVADGHDKLGCVLEHRTGGAERWRETPMRDAGNDTWVASFTPTELGAWEFRVRAWADRFLTWAHDLRARLDAAQVTEADLEIGAEIINETARHAGANDAELSGSLERWADRLKEARSVRERAEAALSPDLASLMWAGSPRAHSTVSDPIPVWVDRPRALFGAWYEMFPRSASPDPGRHGTLADTQSLLPYVASMGFDVLYLPPIHPIGQTSRKGPNNSPDAGPDDVGSPWAIGSHAGGHKAIHPELGTFEDFDRLVRAAREHGLEIALDIAFQCSPDHPYVREHPEWFRHRPDGSIQYAENPPKKYQDIYPLDFECEDWRGLWEELLGVFRFWIARGVRIFRVDNPHTKPFGFWEWVIAAVRETDPDVIFLSEAFTRPKRMARLAKIGFTQSYTYFAWRTTPGELREYVQELASAPMRDTMRPSFWPNTPDILTEQLQSGGRPCAMARLVLAATLSPSYGIYGPVFELCDFAAREGAEENLDSEKYHIRHWNRDDPWSLRHFIAAVNRIRRENPALARLGPIAFHHCDDPAHLAYSKRSGDGRNIVLCVVNTDAHATRAGLVRLDLARLGIGPDERFTAHDLLTDTRYVWRGADNYVSLEAGLSHIFRVEPANRTERDFEGFA